MHILLTTAHPGASGPILRLTWLMKYGFEQLGCRVDTAGWGQRCSHESLVEKMTGRAQDLAHILRLLRQKPYDIVFVNTTADWPGLIRDIPLFQIFRDLRIPYVLLHHGSYAGKVLQDRAGLYRFLYAWSLRGSTGLFTLSSVEKKIIHQVWPGCRAAVVKLPFSANDPVKKPCEQGNRQRSELVLLFVARMVEAKGPLVLLRALPYVLAQAPCRLVMVGGGPSLKDARRLAREFGIESRVDFMGKQDSGYIWELLRGADIFVLPTYNEGFPVAVLEALSAGLPIITTHAGGLADWLVDGVNSLFVPVGDEQALAAQIVRLVQDPALRLRMSAANLELVQQFEPVSVMREYLRCMEIWTGNNSTVG